MIQTRDQRRDNSGKGPVIRLLPVLLSLGVMLPCCRDSGSTKAPEKSKTASNRRFTHEVKGTLKKVAGIQVLSLQGSPEEMGYSEGALLCGRMTRFFQDYYLDFLAALLQRSFKSYANIRRQAMESFTLSEPDKRQLRGLLMGMRERCPAEDLLIQEAKDGPRRELQYEDLVAGHALVDMLLAACSSFTVWGKSSATGGTLHGRNLDFLPDPGGTFLQQQMIKVHSPGDGKPRWASLAWPGNLGCPTCFAEDGSGQSSHGGNGLPSETTTGNTLSMLAVRDAFLSSLAVREGGDRVAAAEATLEKTATMTKGANLHFFWPGHGGVAVLEYDGVRSHADGRVTVRRNDASRPGSSESMLCVPSYEKRRTVPHSGTNKAMYEILAKGVKASSSAGGMDARAAWQLLASSAAANKLPTLHTLVMDIKKRKLLLSFARKVGQDSNLVKPAEIDLSQIFVGLR
jgi:hypothetical protein